VSEAGSSDVVVVGAGVSGLTTALCLAQTGLRVRLLARLPPAASTSAAAGASWGPYLVTDPRIGRWSAVTLTTFEKLADDRPGCGVRLVEGVEAALAAVTPPEWARGVRGFRLCATSELPDGYRVGWRYTLPLLEMPAYLGYLERSLARYGVAVQLAEVTSFAQLADVAPVVVNCAGFGAARLVPDPLVHATRGQLVVVANPGIDEFFQEHDESDELTYVLPHGDHVVLGGSAVPGDGPLEPDPAIAAGILRRCVRVVPRLAGAPVLEHRVGVRPSRTPVRFGWDERREAPRVFHNYGHGGAGVTVSWGCATEAADEICRALGR
jgi:D-amino-acid oxidase